MIEKLRVGTVILDKYNRKLIVVESVQKAGANGEAYTLYNLYPPTQKPKKATEYGQSLGLYYEPCLYITDSTLKEITKQAN